jgi:hypothetical protein
MERKKRRSAIFKNSREKKKVKRKNKSQAPSVEA